MALAAHLAHMLQEGRPINSQARGARDQKKLFRIKNKMKTLVSKNKKNLTEIYFDAGLDKK